jgi:hypothetical protein
LPAAELVAIGRQIAGAVGAAHQRGIIHRDLKPDNIFLIPDGEMPFGLRVKVLDFGVCKLTGEMESPLHTQTLAIIGTPAYMSPEQCRGAGTVDSRTDVYSLGCILYRMACGRHPFVGHGAGEVMAAHLYAQPDPPSQVTPGMPVELEQLILRALSKKREERPQTMDLMIDALDALPGLAPSPRAPRTPTLPGPGGAPKINPAEPTWAPQGDFAATIATVAGSRAPSRVAAPTADPAPPLASFFCAGLAANLLGAKFQELDARPQRVASWLEGSERRFAALMVRDAGPVEWWWYAGLDVQQLEQRVAEHQARLADVESWPSGGGDDRFGVVLVRDGTGGPWSWVHGAEEAALEQMVEAQGARLLDLDARCDGGAPRFTAVMAPGDGTPWWWAHGVSANDAVRHLERHAARPVAVKSWLDGAERRVAVVMVPRGGVAWQWFAGLTADEVSAKLAEPGAWIADFEVVLDGGAPRFGIILCRS